MTENSVTIHQEADTAKARINQSVTEAEKASRLMERSRAPEEPQISTNDIGARIG